jgi:hypothetical protein
MTVRNRPLVHCRARYGREQSLVGELFPPTVWLNRSSPSHFEPPEERCTGRSTECVDVKSGKCSPGSRLGVYPSIGPSKHQGDVVRPPAACHRGRAVCVGAGVASISVAPCGTPIRKASKPQAATGLGEIGRRDTSADGQTRNSSRVGLTSGLAAANGRDTVRRRQRAQVAYPHSQ